MPIIQEAFDIPVDIANGIATGRFKRIGGVVRIAKGYEGAGQVVTHLDPVPVNKEVAEVAAQVAKTPIAASKETASVATSVVKTSEAGIVPKVTGFIVRNRVPLIIGGVAIVAITAGVATYIAVSNKEPKELCVVRERFNDYLTAVNNGTVDFLVVDQLAKALDDLKSLKNYDKIEFQLTAEEFSTLIGQILLYTQKLAKDNDYKCSSDESMLLKQTEDPVFDLRSYLEIQKRIIIDVA